MSEVRQSILQKNREGFRMFQSVEVGFRPYSDSLFGSRLLRRTLESSAGMLYNHRGHYIVLSEFSVKTGPWSCATQLSSTHCV